MIRTSRIPFIQSRAAAPLFAMTAAIIAVGIFLTMAPSALKLLALPLFPILMTILLGYMTRS